VQAFLHCILDIDEVLADAGGAEPYSTLSPDGPLVHARASPIDERVTAQLDGDFRISRQLRRQLSRLVAPYLREKVRPSPVVGRLEHSAGNIFIDRVAKRTHRESPSRKRDV
jgi:hypothetical protein